MVKLVERALVKDLLRIPRADTMQDSVLNTFIDQASRDAEKFTRRKFEKAARTEYYTSYDQMPFDPEPQFVALNAYPVDLAEDFLLQFSGEDHRDGSSRDMSLTAGDYTIDAETGILTVRTISALTSSLPLRGTNLFSYQPRGFKVLYTGGYAVSVEPESHTDDPLDDFGVADVPSGLKLVVAKKVIADFRGLTNDTLAVANAHPETGSEAIFKIGLRPWAKKDMI